MQRSKRGKIRSNKNSVTKSSAKSNSGGANSAQQIVNINMGETIKRKLEEQVPETQVPETQVKPIPIPTKKPRTEDTSILRQNLRKVIIDYQRTLDNLSPALRTPDIADVPDELLTPTTSAQIQATINWLTNAINQAQQRARTTVFRPMHMQPGVQVFQPLDQQYRISQLEQSLRSREDQLSELDRGRQLSRAPPQRFPTPATKEQPPPRMEPETPSPGLTVGDLFDNSTPSTAHTQSLNESLTQLELQTKAAEEGTYALREAIKKTAQQLEEAQTADDKMRKLQRIEKLQSQMRQMENDFIVQLEEELKKINESGQNLSANEIQSLDRAAENLMNSSASYDNVEQDIEDRMNQAIKEGKINLRDGEQTYKLPPLTHEQRNGINYIRLITRELRSPNPPLTPEARVASLLSQSKSVQTPPQATTSPLSGQSLARPIPELVAPTRGMNSAYLPNPSPTPSPPAAPTGISSV